MLKRMVGPLALAYGLIATGMAVFATGIGSPVRTGLFVQSHTPRIGQQDQ